jgi:hypothetical protein
MALPRRQRRLLEAIDRRMESEDPELARPLAVFCGLWAGQPLPAREQFNTRASRFWPVLSQALAASAWQAPLTPPSPGGAGCAT